MSIGDRKGALIDFQESVNVNPNYDEAFGNLCAVKFDLKEYYGAIADCNKAIKISPKERYFFNRGNEYFTVLKVVIKLCSSANLIFISLFLKSLFP